MNLLKKAVFSLITIVVVCFIITLLAGTTQKPNILLASDETETVPYSFPHDGTDWKS